MFFFKSNFPMGIETNRLEAARIYHGDFENGCSESQRRHTCFSQNLVCVSPPKSQFPTSSTWPPY